MPELVVDLHAHHLGVEVLEAIAADGHRHGLELADGPRGTHVDLAGRRTGLPAFAALSDVEARERWLTQRNIDVQLVAGWMDLAAPHLPGPPARWLHAQVNDALAALAASAPGRYVPAAMVPLQAPALAVQELTRAVEELGHRAVQIGTRIGDVGLDDPDLEPFWSRAEELGVPVLVHPAELDVPDRSRRLFLQILVSNPADTTLAAAALLLGGVLERHPGLQVVLAHGGGFLPYQLGRLRLAAERAPAPVRPRATGPLDDGLAQLHHDTILHDTGALAHLVATMGAERVVLGSDYPFPMRDDDPVASVHLAVPDADRRRAVLGSNALALVGARTREEIS